MRRLYMLAAKDACLPSETWLNEIRDTFTCSRCRTPTQAARKSGIDISLKERPGKAALYGTGKTRAEIARRDLVELLEPEVSAHFSLGAVAYQGAILPEWVSLLSQFTVRIRGGPKSQISGYCPECARPYYRATLPFCVLKQDVPWDTPIFGATLAAAIMREELSQRIDQRKFKGLYVEPIDVRDEPLDGITDIPNPR